MLLKTILGLLAFLSLLLLLWQWLVARRFPLHQRVHSTSFTPAVSILKPLKGCDQTTESCLRSWLDQSYPGKMQVLFAVASAADPVCMVVKKLLQEFPKTDARLIVCGPLVGTNLKVSKLMELEREAVHDTLVISDADVSVAPDLLANVVVPLQDLKIGLVNCFYRLADPVTRAMEWEAIAINADFWSQVLQSESLQPLDFALGAVMVVRRSELEQMGGFAALADCLADDYQLGHRIARQGYRIVISPVVVDCHSAPMGWGQVWKHQLRWARTIRVCQPLPYFFSILSNPTLWPLIWWLAWPTTMPLVVFLGGGLIRILAAGDLQRRLTHKPLRPATAALVPIKDLLQSVIWLMAFLGNQIEWRGERFRLRRDGTLVKA